MMASRSRGETILALLGRVASPAKTQPLCTLEDMKRAAPLLMRTGSGALAWRSLRGTPLESAAHAAGLRQSYRLHTLQAAIGEHDLVRLLTAMNAEGVIPLLVKGPVIAEVYPAPGLRPYSDFDLCIRPEEAEAAARAKLAAGELSTMVEFHLGHVSSLDRDMGEVRARALPFTAGETSCLMPAPEDHLRLLALHMLLHGGWRPVWVLDLGLFLRRLPDPFYWDLLLDGPPWERRAVQEALRLAVDFFGPGTDGLPEWLAAPPLPWLRAAVLDQWGRGPGSSATGPLEAGHLQKPAFRRLLAHWRGPIQATMELKAPWNGIPRLPFQAAATARRAPDLLRRVYGERR